MSELRIRNVDDWIVETFKSLARINGRSMEAEIKNVLMRQALGSHQQLAGELAAISGEIQQKYGLLSDSARLIREDRDSRG